MLASEPSLERNCRSMPRLEFRLFARCNASMCFNQADTFGGRYFRLIIEARLARRVLPITAERAESLARVRGDCPNAGTVSNLLDDRGRRVSATWANFVPSRSIACRIRHEKHYGPPTDFPRTRDALRGRIVSRLIRPYGATIRCTRPLFPRSRFARYRESNPLRYCNAFPIADREIYPRCTVANRRAYSKLPDREELTLTR